jgi:zinc and cadmium transporter
VQLFLTILLFAALGGIASAVFAVVFLWLREDHSALILPHLVSFATGALLGAALLALLPEAIVRSGPAGAYHMGLALLAGLAAFFAIEKLVLWWHVHGDHGAGAAAEQVHDPPGSVEHRGHEHVRAHASGVLVLVGDSVHNALDGVLIAAAFLTSTGLGFLTTFAVAAHEIPHRVGDFALLVHAGFSRLQALLLNLATGITSVIGAGAAYFAFRGTMSALPYALAFAAAGFLYIALAGLVPVLHRRAGPGAGLSQIVLIAAGIAVVAGAEWIAG